MKSMIRSFIAVLSLSFVIISCQKDKSNTDDNSAAEISTHSDDQSRFSSEIDAVANDANLMIEATSGFAGRGQEVQSLICDATVVVDTVSNPRTITITYNGSNCIGNRTRTGVVILSANQGVRWKDAGAIINVSFQNLKITRVSDNKSITINGTQTYTNVSGGLLVNLPTLGTITHTITSSNMSITFDNATQHSWQVARRRVFTYDNGLVVTINGMHTDGNVTNIAEWGTNRFGGTFSTSTLEPIVARQDCNARITSGKLKHITPLITATVTYGLDVAGNPTSCPGTGNYYFKLEWTGPAGNSNSIILPY